MDSFQSISLSKGLHVELQDTPQERKRRTLYSLGSPLCCCIQCFIIGSLVIGIILAVILALWLKPLATTTTQMKISSTSSSSTITSTTTITTTITAVSFPCPPVSTTSNNLIYITTISTTQYQCYSFAWQAPTTKTMDLVFQMRYMTAGDFWYLDDVSIYSGSNSMIGNGDFETGNLSPWTVSSTCTIGTGAQVINSACRTGIYCVRDACRSTGDQLRQSFSAVAGETYIISFWLKWTKAASNSFTNVTLV